MRNMLLTLVFTLLAGCVSFDSFIETKVSAFHELEPSLSGVTYTLVPSKEQEGSLEFQYYAKLVKAIPLHTTRLTPMNQLVTGRGLWGV
jgi:hypothetical protein